MVTQQTKGDNSWYKKSKHVEPEPRFRTRSPKMTFCGCQLKCWHGERPNNCVWRKMCDKQLRLVFVLRENAGHIMTYQFSWWLRKKTLYQDPHLPGPTVQVLFFLSSGWQQMVSPTVLPSGMLVYKTFLMWFFVLLMSSKTHWKHQTSFNHILDVFFSTMSEVDLSYRRGALRHRRLGMLFNVRPFFFFSSNFWHGTRKVTWWFSTIIFLIAVAKGISISKKTSCLRLE